MSWHCSRGSLGRPKPLPQQAPILQEPWPALLTLYRLQCNDGVPPDLYVEVDNEGWWGLCCLCRSWCGLGVQHGLWQCCGGHHKAKTISSPQAQTHVTTGLSEVRQVGLQQHTPRCKCMKAMAQQVQGEGEEGRQTDRSNTKGFEHAMMHGVHTTWHDHDAGWLASMQAALCQPSGAVICGTLQTVNHGMMAPNQL